MNTRSHTASRSGLNRFLPRLLLFVLSAQLFLSLSVIHAQTVHTHRIYDELGLWNSLVVARAAAENPEHADTTFHLVLMRDIVLDAPVELRHSNVVIDGNGHSIDGNNLIRIFHITGGKVTLRNLTLRNGRAVGHDGHNGAGAGAGMGGAIVVDPGAELTVENCLFENNRAVGGTAFRQPTSGPRIVVGSTTGASREFPARGDRPIRPGKPGLDGLPGWRGADGERGADGSSPYALGARGGNGLSGKDGSVGGRGGKGADGHVPGAAGPMNLITAFQMWSFVPESAPKPLAAGDGGDGGDGGNGGDGGDGGRGAFGGGGGKGAAGGDGALGGPGGDSGMNVKLTAAHFDDRKSVALAGRNGNSGDGGDGGNGGDGGFGGGGGIPGPPGKPALASVVRSNHYNYPAVIAGYKGPYHGLVLLHATTGPHGTLQTTKWIEVPKAVHQPVAMSHEDDWGYSFRNWLHTDLGSFSSTRSYVIRAAFLNRSADLHKGFDHALGASPLLKAGKAGASGVEGFPGSGGFGGGGASNLAGGQGGGGAGMGGAIFVRNDAVVTIVGSTFLENSVVGGSGANRGMGYGGAIFNMGDLTVVNSTFGENTAADDGGAIYQFHGVYDPAEELVAESSLLVRFSTIVYNEAQGGGGGICRHGEGDVTIRESIVALNEADDGLTPDLKGSDFLTEHNLFGIIGVEGTLARRRNDIEGTPESPVDPELHPLADNGGWTPTYAPRLGGRVMDAVQTLEAIPDYDQRGKARFSGDHADIGAVEFDAITFPPSQLTLERAITLADPGAAIVLPEFWDGAVLPMNNLIIGKNLTIDASHLEDGITLDGGSMNRILTVSGDSVLLKGIRFTNGKATDGGAIYVAGGDLTLAECSILESQAIRGGGIFVAAGASATVDRSTMAFNEASDSGGAVYAASAGRFEMTSSTVSGNSPNGLAGAGTMGVWFSTIYENGESGIAATGEAAELGMSIVAGHTEADVAGAVFSVGSNLIGDDSKAPLIGGASGTVLNGTDPQLEPLRDNGGPTLTHALATASPARDRISDSGGMPPADQRNLPRFRNGKLPYTETPTADLGAVEMQGRAIFVKAGATGSNSGSDWENAFTDLAEVVALAEPEDIIYVAQGVYRPHYGDGVGLWFRTGTRLFGGYRAASADDSVRDPELYPTVISGDLGDDDVNKVNGVTMDAADIRGENLHTVIQISGPPRIGTRIDGVTVTGGSADRLTEFEAVPDHVKPLSVFLIAGGGIYQSGNDDLVIENTVLQGNRAYAGGGMYIRTGGGSSRQNLRNMRFVSNRDIPGMPDFGGVLPSESGGAGLFSFAILDLTDVTFLENEAFGPGGGMWVQSLPPTMDRVAFLENTARDGAGLYVVEAWAEVSNSVFSRNSATRYGGAIYSVDSPMELRNSTISRNSAGAADSAGGWQIDPPEGTATWTRQPRAENNIFWNNTSSLTETVHQQIFTTRVQPLLAHNLVQSSSGFVPMPGSGAIVDEGGNIFGMPGGENDPGFFEDFEGSGFGEKHDLRISGSAAIDGGDNDRAPDVAFDFNRMPRALDGDKDGVVTVDIGAYESPGTARLTSVTAEERTTEEPMTWRLVFDKQVFDVDPSDFAVVPDAENPEMTASLDVAQADMEGKEFFVFAADFNQEGWLRLDWAEDAWIADAEGLPFDPAEAPEAPSLLYDLLPAVMIGEPDPLVSAGEPVAFPLLIEHAHALADDAADAVQTVVTGDLSFDVSITGTFPDHAIVFSNLSGAGTLAFSLPAGFAVDDRRNETAATESSVEIRAITDAEIAVSSPDRLRTSRGPIRFEVSYNREGTIRLSPADVTLVTTGTADAIVKIERGISRNPVVVLTSISGSGTLQIIVNGTSAETMIGQPFPDALASPVVEVVDAAAIPEIIYVKADAIGVNDGSSWEDAMTNLGDALTLAGPGTEVWVAEGVYTPAGVLNSREDRLTIGESVRVYGGFAGTETERDQRNPNPLTNNTVLSGDIHGDDSQSPVVTDLDELEGGENNSYTVVEFVAGAADAVLDGFTITGGAATGFGADAENPARQGGGIFVGEATATLANLRIAGNRAASDGGGVFVRNGSIEATNTFFTGNRSGAAGGAVAVRGGGMLLTDTLFAANEAEIGGGLAVIHGVVDAERLEVRGNLGRAGGGGVYIQTGSFAARNSLFSGNAADSGPTAFRSGGGLYVFDDASLYLENVTIVGNRATGNGGGIFAGHRATVDIANSILWKNVGSFPAIFPQVDVERVTVDHSLTISILRYMAAIDWRNGISQQDPLFVSGIEGTDAPTVAGDFRLLEGSPAIDAGGNALLDETVELDLDGNARVFDADLDGVATVDMGAYEFQNPLPPDAPVLSHQMVEEGLPPGTVVGEFSATDPNPGDLLNIQLVAGPGDEGNTAFAIEGWQLVTAETLDYDTRSVYSIRVAVTDSSGLSTERNFQIDVIHVGENQPPAAIDDWFVIYDGARPRNENVLTGRGADTDDSDPDGDPITVHAINNDPELIGVAFETELGTTLTMQADGSFTYQTNGVFAYLLPDEPVEEIFTYTISDGRGGFSTATLTVEIRGTDNPPEAAPDHITRIRGGITKIRIADLLANDFDADGDPISVVLNPNDMYGPPDPFGFPTWSANGADVRIAGGDWIVYDATVMEDTGEPDEFDYVVYGSGGWNFGTVHLTAEVPNFQIQPVAPLGISYDSGNNSTVVTAHFIGVPGTAYRIEAAPSIDDESAWEEVTIVTAARNGRFSITEENLPGHVVDRSYRASIEPEFNPPVQ